MLEDSTTIRLIDTLAARQTPLYRRRSRSRLIWQMVAVSGVIIMGSSAVYPMLPRIYTANADVLLRPTNQEGATTWDQSVRDALDDNAIQTKIDILRTEPLQMAVLKKNDLLADLEFNPSLDASTIVPEWLKKSIPWIEPWWRRHPPRAETLVLSKLLKNLSIKRERKSYVMQIGYQSTDPVKTAKLTNSLVEAFLADQIGRKEQSHDEILSSLNDRVKSLEERYHKDEEAEHQFVVSSGLIHVADKVSMEKQVETLSMAAADAHRRSAETTNRAVMLAGQRSDLDNTSDALSSPLLQRLRERLVELSSGAGAGNVPSGMSQTVLNSLHQRIELETQHLIKAAQNDASVALQNELSLRNGIQALDAQLVQWEINERHRLDLHRAVQTSLDALNGANQRYMQEAGRGDVLQADIEIVSSAGIPDRPSSPNTILYASGTLALVLLCNGLLLLPTIVRATRAGSYAR
jgi:uncharacterized protein involved in exopolysaccharide biosynthesis